MCKLHRCVQSGRVFVLRVGFYVHAAFPDRTLHQIKLLFKGDVEEAEQAALDI